MPDERWEQIRSIFEYASRKEPDERARFLKDECGGDDSLRREVEDLLASSEAAKSFMETPLAGELADRLGVGPANRIEPGQVFGRYKIERKIGVGGMGEVFLAQDSELDRQVAIKILHTEAAANKDWVRRFIQEAKSASALNHPNIITVHEIGNFDKAQYIATELIKGVTLRDRLNGERLSLSETLDIAVQVATALSAAHDAGIVHRDIKPENIMLRDDGLAKVLDFGLAKLTEPPAAAYDSGQKNRDAGIRPSASDRDTSWDATHADTAPGTVMGTVNYMSPEQARGKATDARTDVWSLAVVLYEMLTLRKPFEDETASDTIAAILTRDPDPFDESVPLELQRIVKKSLQKKPDERYQTIRDFLLDVKNLKRELEFSDELERLRIPAFPRSGKNTTAMDSAVISTQNSPAPQISSAEYLINEVAKRKFISLSVLGILLAALVGAGFFYWYVATASINSVAVLPFVNAGGDLEQEYLSDGISEALINNLSQLPQLKVIARTSSFQYKGKNIDPQEVANALGVKAIIMGRVTQHGDDLNISAEMINAADRTQIWGETYNRKATDAQNIQEEIARMVSEKLRLSLTGGQQQQIAKSETRNPQAYDLRLRATSLGRKGGLANTRQAIELLDQAIALDPNYAAAYARQSISYGNIPNLGGVDPKEFQQKAETAALKAVELDPNLDEAHNALAAVKDSNWEWAEAEREYKRAIELNANSVAAHANYAYLLSFTRRHELALAEMRRAIELDPLRGDARIALSYILNSARRYDEAVQAAKLAIEINPESSEAYISLGRVYGNKKMYAEAIAAVHRIGR